MKQVTESFALNQKGELVTSDGMSISDLVETLKNLPTNGAEGN